MHCSFNSVTQTLLHKMSEPAETLQCSENTSEKFVEDGKNKMIIKCKYCGSKILEKKAGTFLVQEVSVLGSYVPYSDFKTYF